MEDYYKILEIDRNASDDEINKSYKRLSKIHHPDKHLDNKDKAEEMFKKINEAKNTLLDKDKRRIYDQFGHDGLKNGGGGPPPNFNPFDLFSNIFHPFSNLNMNKNKPNVQTQHFQENITLEQVHKGYNHKKKIKISSECNVCNGLGKKDFSSCSTCHGRGSIITENRLGPLMTRNMTECNKCLGKGKIGINDNCNKCNGDKRIDQIIEINILFKKGVTDSDFYTYKFDNYEFIFHPNIKEHSLFKRENNTNNLLLFKDITLEESILGINISIKLLDDTSIIIKNKPNSIINTYTKYILKNLGIENEYGVRGDLIIQFNIKYPLNLDDPQINKIKSFLNEFSNIKQEEIIDNNVYFI